MSAPDWTKMIPGMNPPKPPPGGWALPNGTGPGFLAVALAMLEDAEMKLPPMGSKARMLYEMGIDEAEYEQRIAGARQEYDALCHGRKEQP